MLLWFRSLEERGFVFVLTDMIMMCSFSMEADIMESLTDLGYVDAVF